MTERVGYSQYWTPPGASSGGNHYLWMQLNTGGTLVTGGALVGGASVSLNWPDRWKDTDSIRAAGSTTGAFGDTLNAGEYGQVPVGMAGDWEMSARIRAAGNYSDNNIVFMGARLYLIGGSTGDNDSFIRTTYNAIASDPDDAYTVNWVLTINYSPEVVTFEEGDIFDWVFSYADGLPDALTWEQGWFLAKYLGPAAPSSED